MVTTFDEALAIAKTKYPHTINHYEEHRDYYVFDHDDGTFRCGGDFSPIVIRKSDAETLNYAPIFFNLDAEEEGVGDVVAEGRI